MSSGKWSCRVFSGLPLRKSHMPLSPSPSRKKNSKTGSEAPLSSSSPRSTPSLKSTSRSSGCSYLTCLKFMKLAFSATATKSWFSWVSHSWVSCWTKLGINSRHKSGNNLTDLRKESLRRLCLSKFSRFKTGRKKSKCLKNLMKVNALQWHCFLANFNKLSKCIQSKSDKTYFHLLNLDHLLD